MLMSLVCDQARCFHSHDKFSRGPTAINNAIVDEVTC